MSISTPHGSPDIPSSDVVVLRYPYLDGETAKQAILDELNKRGYTELPKETTADVLDTSNIVHRIGNGTGVYIQGSYVVYVRYREGDSPIILDQVTPNTLLSPSTERLTTLSHNKLLEAIEPIPKFGRFYLPWENKDKILQNGRLISGSGLNYSTLNARLRDGEVLVIESGIKRNGSIGINKLVAVGTKAEFEEQINPYNTGHLLYCDVSAIPYTQIKEYHNI
ncbi:hypothetical protein HOO68_02350 [Candidatus Gracilibacteria bacterium]|nr:hypothetical protein [Candidatus Gracilibacteria bacterium]